MQKYSCSSLFQFPYFTGDFGNNILRTVPSLGEKNSLQLLCKEVLCNPRCQPLPPGFWAALCSFCAKRFHFTTPSETESTFCLRQSCSSAMPIIKDASQTCIPGFQSDSEVLPHLSSEWLKVPKRQRDHRESHTVLMSIAWMVRDAWIFLLKSLAETNLLIFLIFFFFGGWIAVWLPYFPGTYHVLLSS